MPTPQPPRPPASRLGGLFTLLLVLAMVVLVIKQFGVDKDVANDRSFQKLQRMAYLGQVENITCIGDGRIDAKVSRGGENPTVEARVEDIRSGEVLRSSRLSQHGEFAPTEGETLSSAQAEAIYFLARDIVRLLEEDF